MRTYQKTLFSILAAILIAVTAFFMPMLTTTVHGVSSSTDIQAAYESTNVLGDLQNSTIGDIPFDLNDFPFNEQGDPQLISFIEYCYSRYSNHMDDYALYIYVYNPQGIEFDTKTDNNQIQFRAGGGKSNKYPLEFLNCSTEAGYEGLFYKFKISLSITQKNNILNNLSSSERIYEVTGIELWSNKTVKEYTVAQTYTYTGFAEGYGSASATEDTLSCKVDGFERYIEAEVYHTAYYPEGDYYMGEQTQLNSCFFRIPTAYIEDYGRLSKIACEWYEYVTKPILVTEDSYIYSKMNSLKGAPLSSSTNGMEFLFEAYGNKDSSAFDESSELLMWLSTADLKSHYEWFSGLINCNEYFNNDTRKDGFSAVFHTGDSSYKDYRISAEDLLKKLLANGANLGAPYVYGEFSEALFTDYVDDFHTRGYNKKEIKADDEMDILWHKTVKSTWQKIFGGYNVSTIYDSRKAIETVDDKVMKLSDSELASELLIANSDVKKFRKEYETAKTNDETLVLFRYSSSKGFSAPCAQSYCSSSEDSYDWTMVKDCHWQWGDAKYSAYVSQQTAFLGWDIISLFFLQNNVETEIPVIHSPQNVVSPVNPPDDENYDKSGLALWQILLLIAALVLIAVVIYKLVKGGLSAIFKK